MKTFDIVFVCEIDCCLCIAKSQRLDLQSEKVVGN